MWPNCDQRPLGCALSLKKSLKNEDHCYRKELHCTLYWYFIKKKNTTPYFKTSLFVIICQHFKEFKTLECKEYKTNWLNNTDSMSLTS